MDKDGRICRRNPFNLLKHSFQSRTVAYNPLESTLPIFLIARFELLQSSHKDLLGTHARWSKQVQLSRAARTFSSRTSSSKGLVRNSVAPALRACIRILASPCAVMKIVGIGQRSEFSLACSSKPDIPGMRISAIRHAVSRCSPDFKNSSAEANACAG